MSKTKDTLPTAIRRVVEDPDRLAVLAELQVLDSPPDADFDRLARMAAALFGAPYAQVTLVDASRQWYRACHGMEGAPSQTGLDVSFCAHTIAADAPQLVVADLSADPRFGDNPFVAGWAGIRFYAGVPIVVRGQRIGTVCVLDRVARSDVAPGLLPQLHDLADMAASLFALKDESRVRARTAAALMREEWRHALTLEAGKVGSWVWDIAGGELACNDMFRRMYDLPEAGPVRIGAVLNAIRPEDRGPVEAAIAQSLEGGTDLEAEMRATAENRWLALRGRVYQRDAAGQAQVMMGVSLDITEDRRSAEQTQRLLRELNHRVKNTLAMIQSVARQTMRQTPEPTLFMDAFSGRLRAISEAHRLLADQDWAGVQLYAVIASQLGDDFHTGAGRTTVRGDDISLPPDHALGLALILHELTTNAHRHGALSGEHGRVEISWAVEEQPVRGLRLAWQEREGPAVAAAPEPGLGTRLIERGLAKVLDSEVTLGFDPEGVNARIWMPLPAE